MTDIDDGMGIAKLLSTYICVCVSVILGKLIPKLSSNTVYCKWTQNHSKHLSFYKRPLPPSRDMRKEAWVFLSNTADTLMLH